jgi:hypothetical protein
MKLSKAYQKMSQALATLYNVKVTVISHTPKKDGVFTDDDVEEKLLTDYPAKISKSGLSTKDQKEFLPDKYDAILIIDTDVQIPAGCDVIATDIHDHETRYKQSTRGYVYQSHQEVGLLFDEKA